jgi:hypothetical protein
MCIYMLHTDDRRAGHDGAGGSHRPDDVVSISHAVQEYDLTLIGKEQRRAHLCMYVYVCMCVYVCVCMCVYVCMCV